MHAASVQDWQLDPAPPAVPLPPGRFTRLTLKRIGEFTLNVEGRDGANHCGLNANQTVGYLVEVACDAQVSLDSRGFLFEQRSVQAFFDGMGSTTHSCEVFSQHCCEGLLRMILAENPQCRVLRMDATLSPQPYAASMTATWEAPSYTTFNR